MTIKQVPLSRLAPGMFIHDLNCDWWSHPFARNQFLLDTEADIAKLASAGIQQVYIDTERGDDAADAPTRDEVRAELDLAMLAAASEPVVPIKTSFAEELVRAKKIHNQAYQLVHTVMQDVRLGHAVHMEGVLEMVATITESILRNQGALVSLLHIKDKDDYTFLHSVSVCTLMVTFGQNLGLSPELVRLGGLGGLLHDVGKMKVPDEILNKPGKLTDAEFEIIKRHPGDGHALLLETPGIGDIPLDIARHHHERLDGRGYPDALPAEQISLMARMAAIVDVYDAITADRCYHTGIPPTEALRRLFEWSKTQFDPKLVQAFMRCIGIYPTGTLVRLESGRLAVVIEQNDGKPLTPRVRAFFSAKAQTYIKPVVVDLAQPLGRGGGDGLDPRRPARRRRTHELLS